MEKCYICEKGNLQKKKVPYEVHGIKIGEFKANVCNKCGEIFFDEKTSEEITEKTKEKGLWRLSSKTKITKTGNSLAARIPKPVADFFKLKSGKEVRIRPEENKIVIELQEQSL